MNSDFKELLQCFARHRVRYLVVGGYAVIQYTQPRFTKDLDLWIEPSAINARRVVKAFHEFNIPLIEITGADLAQPGVQFMLGRPPVMMDFLTSIPPLEFATCWFRRKRVRHDFGTVNYLARTDLITAKRHAGRAQDNADLEELLREWPD
jgi:hypothetical protein